MNVPERSPERDAAIDALLPHVMFDGWTYKALRAGLRSIGQPEVDAELLFPGGATDMIEAFFDLADRNMEQAASAIDMSALRTPKRVREVLRLRFEQNRGAKEAIRRALSVLLLPRNVQLAARCAGRTVDAVWHAAGDRSSDFSWYTKRAILASIYGPTLFFWLGDNGLDDEATLAFLDRRLSGVGRIGKVRSRIEGALGRLKPGGTERPA